MPSLVRLDPNIGDFFDVFAAFNWQCIVRIRTNELHGKFPKVICLLNELRDKTKLVYWFKCANAIVQTSMVK